MQCRLLATACVFLISGLATAEGVSGQRLISALSFNYSVTDSPGQADVAIKLGGDKVDHFVLTSSKPLHAFAVEAGTTSAHGILSYSIAASPYLSHIDGSFTVMAGK